MRSREMFALVAVLACSLLFVGTLSAQTAPSNMTAAHPSAFAVSPPLSQISQQASPAVQTVVPLRTRSRPMALAGAAALGQADEALQTSPGDRLERDDDNGGGALFPGAGANGYAPGDPNMAVGPNHIVQMVNTQVSVYDKNGNIFSGYPKTLGSIFANLGGTCTGEWGDPIAQYDKVADRWVLSQLGSFSAPYLWCIAVSQTNDPTGAYYLWSYSFDNYANSGLNFLPDYPKVSVWPTSTNSAYVATYNLFQDGISAYGTAVCAYDRAAMLTGAASPLSICFTIVGDLSYLGSDFDGSNLPPASAPNYLFTWETGTTVRFYSLSPNFATPGSSTLTGPTDITVAALTLACGGTGGTCIPQANTSQQLDSLGDRLMYRLAYRNFGDHDALVVNQSVDTGSTVGVRWYEFRSPLNGAFTLYQEGTFAPDLNYRWMGSAAMDQAGDIALGYSESSGSMFPSIYYTGRTPTDPLGTMRSETSLFQGTGSQTGLSRWGDYSALRVDPTDDCTFWYTNQILPSTGSFNWTTWIGSFKFGNCGASPGDFSVSGSPASQTVVQGNSTSYSVTVAPSGGFTGAVSLSASGLPSGANATFSPNPIPGGSVNSTMSVTTSSNTPAGTYTLTITGTGNSGSLSHTATVTLIVNPTADFSISASPSTRTVTAGGSTTYTATVTPSGGFTDSVTFGSIGVPSGVGATFNPTSVNGGSGSSTMSVTTNPALSAGTYQMTITGTDSGNVTHTTTVILVVNAAASDFSVSASPASRTVTQSGSTTYTATVTPLGSFNGNVMSLSVSGLPSGANGTFSPASITGGSGNSTLNVTTSSSTPAGSYTLTIRGTSTSPSLTHTTTVTLVVNGGSGSFSISVSPSSQSVTRPNSTTYTVTVTGSNGFAGTVRFSVRGLPSNSSASFSPSSVVGQGTSTMTVSTTASTSTGTFSLRVRGTSDGVTHSANTAQVVVQ